MPRLHVLLFGFPLTVFASLNFQSTRTSALRGASNFGEADGNISNRSLSGGHAYDFLFSCWSIYLDADICDPASGLDPVICKAQKTVISKCPGADVFPGHMTIIYNVGGPMFVGSMTGHIAQIIYENNFKPFNVSVELANVHYKDSFAGKGWTFGDWKPYQMRYLQLNIKGDGELLKLSNAITEKFGGGDAAAEGGFHPHFSLIYLPLKDDCFNVRDAMQLFKDLPSIVNVNIPVKAVELTR